MNPCTSQLKPKKETKTSTLKKFLIFWEMKLSCSNIKKILIFSGRKAFLIFSPKKSFLIFLKTEPCTTQPMPKKETKKSTPKKILGDEKKYNFRKWNFLALIFKTISIFPEVKPCTFLPQPSKFFPKKFFIFFL